MIEDRLAFQLGFGHISDQAINLYSGGVRSAYATEPFNYYFSLDAEFALAERGRRSLRSHYQGRGRSYFEPSFASGPALSTTYFL